MGLSSRGPKGTSFSDLSGKNHHELCSQNEDLCGKVKGLENTQKEMAEQ